MTNEIEALKRAHPPFGKGISFEDFVKKVNSLTTDKLNFVRASLLFQQALKCKKCEPNISMVLLCSCADALKIAGENAGSHKNFKEFYMKYCPPGLRVPPMKYYVRKKLPLVQAPFENALDFIYAKFRCLYVHEGVGHLDLPPSDEGISLGSFFLDLYEDDAYSIDTSRVLDWFEEVTFASLSSML